VLRGSVSQWEDIGKPRGRQQESVDIEAEGEVLVLARVEEGREPVAACTSTPSCNTDQALERVQVRY